MHAFRREIQFYSVNLKPRMPIHYMNLIFHTVWIIYQPFSLSSCPLLTILNSCTYLQFGAHVGAFYDFIHTQSGMILHMHQVHCFIASLSKFSLWPGVQLEWKLSNKSQVDRVNLLKDKLLISYFKNYNQIMVHLYSVLPSSASTHFIFTYAVSLLEETLKFIANQRTTIDEASLNGRFQESFGAG